MRTREIESTQLGPIVLSVTHCDECGKRWPADDEAFTTIEVRRTGIVSYADWTELHFCSEACLRSRFA